MRNELLLNVPIVVIIEYQWNVEVLAHWEKIVDVITKLYGEQR